jgi:hypothetical protein
MGELRFGRDGYNTSMIRVLDEGGLVEVLVVIASIDSLLL